MVFVFLLTITAFLGGCVAHFIVWQRRLRGEPTIAQCDECPSPRSTLASLAALFPVLATVIANAVAAAYMTDAIPKSPDTVALFQSVLVINVGGIGYVLIVLLAGGRHTADDLGLVARRPFESLRTGVFGFLIAYPMVMATILLTANLRSRETQNPLLTMVQDDPSFLTIGVIGIVAVVLAPLAEELVFRVVLQGWLRNRLRPVPAIVLTALLFAFVHGWPDSIALVPLALVLGWLYEVRNDYWTIVVTHATFNALNLVLALNVDPEAIREAERTAAIVLV